MTADRRHLADFDFRLQPSASIPNPATLRARIAQQPTCSGFAKSRMSFSSAIGPPGVGKSHLAKALGMEIILAGLSSMFDLRSLGFASKLGADPILCGNSFHAV